MIQFVSGKAERFNNLLRRHALELRLLDPSVWVEPYKSRLI